MSARHASPVQALLVSGDFDGEVYPREPMARHTTYRIGGPARFFVQADSLGALTSLVDACEGSGTSWSIVGKGSNLLVADEGYDGVAISLGRDFRSLNFDEGSLTFSVGAGYSLSALVQEAFRRSLKGMEFAVGTPGSVGGALYMNAGTAGDWIGSRVASVTTYSTDQGLRKRLSGDLEWGYRTGPFEPNEAIVECELIVERADPFFIRGRMEAALKRRSNTQPRGAASCGSVFANPEGAFAAELIESAGLKGLRCGGAEVSQVHANFIVNVDGATARDVVDLIELVRSKVYEAHGIELQPEVRFLGFA